MGERLKKALECPALTVDFLKLRFCFYDSGTQTQCIKVPTDVFSSSRITCVQISDSDVKLTRVPPTTSQMYNSLFVYSKSY